MLKRTLRVSACGGLALRCFLFGGAEARADEAHVEAPKLEKRPAGFRLSALIGGSIRLGEAPLFDVAQRGGVNAGLGFAYLLHPLSVGLSYEHVSLGADDSGVVGFGSVNIARAVDTVWASLHVRLSASEVIVPYFGVGLGGVWQSARVSGIFLSGGGLYGGQSFGCSATDSLNLALRANVGAEVPLGKAVSLVFEGALDAYRLSSEIFEDCAPGAGTTSAVLLRGGLTYRFDLTEGRESKPVPSAAQVR